MPQTIEFNGETHVFPDDFNDDDIKKALGGTTTPAIGSQKPQSTDQLNSALSRQFLSDQMSTAGSSLKQFGSGAIDTLKGLAQQFNPIPQTQTESAIASGGPMGNLVLPVHRAVTGIYDLAKSATQVPAAIKDLYNAGGAGVAALANQAPYAGGQAATAMVLQKLGGLAQDASPMSSSDAIGMIRKGVLPKDPDFVPNLQKNIDTLSAAEKTGPPVSTKAQFSDLLRQTAQRHYEAYESLLKPNETSTIGTRQIKGYSGDTLGGEGEQATLRQLDNRLNVINNTLRDAKAGVSGPLGTEGIAPLKAEATAIRRVLYPEIQRLTGTDPAPIKGAMGQLNDLQRSVSDSEIQRFNQINRPIDAPTTTKAGVVARIGGSVQRKIMGDPQDVAIKKAFQGLRNQ